MVSTFLFRLMVLALLWSSPSLSQPVSAQPIILAVHPYLPVSEIQTRFAPLAKYLSQQLGRPVDIRVGASYSEHIEAIGRDEVDIAFMGPALFVMLTERFGPKPVLASFQVGRKPFLEGVITVRQDSPIHSLAELKAKRFAFGDPDSTMGHIVPRYMMSQAGVSVKNLSEYRFLNSHKNVAMGVLVGDFDAGALKREVFDEFASKGLRILVETPVTPDHLFVANNKLTEAEVTRMREALLTLHLKPGGAEVLAQLHKGLSAFVTVDAHQYDVLKPMVRAVGNETR